MAIENGRNSEFSHSTWWIFPVRFPFTQDGPSNPKNPYDKSHIKLPIGITINYMGFLFILGFLLININY